MSWAFPKELLAKSDIAPIMCARSRASKLDDISAKASALAGRGGHAWVPGRSSSHSRAAAAPGRQRADSREPALGLPTQAQGQGEAWEKPLLGTYSTTTAFLKHSKPHTAF